MIDTQPDVGPVNFLLAGVGGQGTILASNVVAEVGLVLGYEAKKAEVHGMSQRGGSVISHVRWGRPVFSPTIARGEVDILVAFEELEAARFVDQLRPGGLVLINRQQIMPVTVSAGEALYPAEPAIQARLTAVTGRVYGVDGLALARKIGNVKTANVTVLGALSALLGHEPEPWLKVVESRVPPRFVELNRQAFEAGRAAVT